jgi:hypothetical protein
MELIKTYGTVIVAIIGLVGVIYTAQHVRRPDTINSLIESLKKLESLDDSDEMQTSIQNIQDAINLETKLIRPFPPYLGLILSIFGILALGACSFISDASWGIGVFVTAILILGFSFWVIPRCK